MVQGDALLSTRIAICWHCDCYSPRPPWRPAHRVNFTAPLPEGDACLDKGFRDCERCLKNEYADYEVNFATFVSPMSGTGRAVSECDREGIVESQAFEMD